MATASSIDATVTATSTATGPTPNPHGRPFDGLECSTQKSPTTNCNRRVLWSVRTRHGVLMFCNPCFDDYFETHDMEPDTITRLSDSEEDFNEKKICSPNDTRRRTRKWGEKWGNDSGSKSIEPLCRIPAPVPKRRSASR